MQLFKELQRRNVFRVAIGYVVSGWLLAQVADLVLENIGAPDWVMQTILLVLALGFPVVLFLSWAYEVTPEGIKRESEVDRIQSTTQVTGRKLDRAITGLLVIALAYFAYDKFVLSGDREAALVEAAMQSATEQAASTDLSTESSKSVAVLPFAALSSGEDDGYFADGLTEEILNSLAALPELLVTARTSSFHFKDLNLPVPEIAATLGVDNVVEGSVRRSGNQLRITAQLIRAADGFHLWSQTYDRTMDDVFAVQEDIATSIAETLNVLLNDERRESMRAAGIGNVEAFIAYQKGQELAVQAHQGGTLAQTQTILIEANRWLDHALDITPDIASAWFESSDYYAHILYDHATQTQPRSEADLDNALREIRRRLGRAAALASSENQRALIESERIVLSEDWHGLSERIDQAFVQPNCLVQGWNKTIADLFGWARQSREMSVSRMRCDPFSSSQVNERIWSEIWSGSAQVGVKVGRQWQEKHGLEPTMDRSIFLSQLAAGEFANGRNFASGNSEDALQIPRSVLIHASNDELESARQTYFDWIETHEIQLGDQLIAAAVLGNRTDANQIAADIDTLAGGNLVLLDAIGSCFCGAPFDLNATPNFKARIEEAGISWPPASPITYPAKDW